jgi:hypothetical protein
MHYAILAYHDEGVVESWTKEEDAAVMAELLQVNDRLVREKCLGPAAPKEQLLGFYVVDCPTIEAAIVAARDLRRANPTVVYEIRPISLYRPGAKLEASDEG